MDWNTCRQNLANRADKGAIQLNKLVPALKAIALQAGADVNVDETWERYQTHYGHRKTYMWCLVNRKARIVMFFYEDCEDEDVNKHEGGRRRRVDNLAAERAIRPLTVQRKNSLFFGSTKGSLNSAVYNTFIGTCKQVGVSFRDYFRAVLKELRSGREDYENLLPMTIGIKQNN